MEAEIQKHERMASPDVDDDEGLYEVVACDCDTAGLPATFVKAFVLKRQRQPSSIHY